MPQNTRRRRSQKPPEQVKIAKERMDILFGEARRIAGRDKALANRYVQLARKIGMRFNVRLSAQQRRQVCRGCKGFLMAGVTARQRLKSGFINTKCNNCGKINKYPYK